MAGPIRILHVIGIMNRGGAETMIMNLYRNIDRTKVQFDFVENSDEPAAFDDEIRALGGRIYRCPHYNGKNHFSYVRWWKEFFRGHRGEYPIVHGHIGSTAAIYLSIAKKNGAYAIAHSHSAGMDSILYRAYSYPTRHIADHFFACSRDAGIVRYGKRIGNNHTCCEVLTNAIDVCKFTFCPQTRTAVRNSLGIDASTFVVGHVGRFAEAKNHAFLIDIFAQIHQRRPDAVLLLVGDGELRPQIEKQIADKGLQDSIILTGVRSDVNRLLQAMDVFVFPSLYEGLPVSIIEAQAAGLPCLISDKVPIECKKTGLVTQIPLASGAQAWADAVFQAVSVPRVDTAEQIRNAGYDIFETAKWLQNYYLEVVNGLGQ